MDTKEMAKALGSTRVLPCMPCGGPLDLLRLAVEIKRIQATEESKAAPPKEAPPNILPNT